MVGDYRIVIGDLSAPYATIQSDEIISVSTINSVDLVGEELPIDVFSPTVIYEYTPPQPFAPSDYDGIMTTDSQVFSPRYTPDLRTLKYGTPIWFYEGTNLIGLYYFNNAERTNIKEYIINSMSAIGLMEKQFHAGGVYDNATFSDILEEIFENIPAEYTIDASLAPIRCFGWLPYATKRENLWQLMFSLNATISKTYTGAYRFKWADNFDPSLAVEISGNSIYQGGSLVMQTKPSAVEVTEYSYMEVYDKRGTTPGKYNKNNAYEVLFDNTGALEPATDKLVKFEAAPIIKDTVCTELEAEEYSATRLYRRNSLAVHDNGLYRCTQSIIIPEEWNSSKWKFIKTVNVLTITELTVNSCKVTGQGVLLGVPYSKNEYVYSLANPDAQEENVVSSNECTLISLRNSDFVAQRMMNYYKNAETINDSFVMTNQRCGNFYRLTNPFREATSGYLTSMRLTPSSKTKAEATFLRNYTPPSADSLFKNYVLISTYQASSRSGTYTTPSEIMSRPVDQRRMRVILVGGGDGGNAGEAGGNGSDGSYIESNAVVPDNANGGQGGAAGEPGLGGKIRILDLKGSQITSTFSYYIGAGGVGGVCIVAENYDPTKTYALGSYCVHDGYYYKCIVAITVAEQWNAAHWQLTDEDVPEPGEDTSFGSWSTAMGGVHVDDGITVLGSDGCVIGCKGREGTKGGNGGRWQDEYDAKHTESESVIFKHYYESTPPETPPKEMYEEITYPGTLWNGRLIADFWTHGFYGGADWGFTGGPAVGGVSNPGAAPGLTPAIENPWAPGHYIAGCVAGSAGNGADAADQGIAIFYGQGGQGGNGGGGGGQGGTACTLNPYPDNLEIISTDPENPDHLYKGGKGGRGGKGGTGHGGAILIYY